MSDVLSPYEKFKVKLLGTPTSVAKRCWLFHSWGPYANAGFTHYIRNRQVLTLMTQFRSCERCNSCQARQQVLK